MQIVDVNLLSPSPTVALPLTDAAFALALVLLVLMPLGIAGVALVNTGLGRARSAAQSLLGSMIVVAVAVLAYASVGTLWPATDPRALHGAFLSGFAAANPSTQLAVLFQLLAVGLAAMIAWGAGADRLRLVAGIAISTILGAVVFPLLANSIWNSGWLASLNTHYGMGANVVDVGGAASVQMLGGLSALVIIWLTGARKGKFPTQGVATALPGHHAVFVLFGCLLALVGWLGTNCAGSLIWLGFAPQQLPIVALNTILMAMTATLATFTMTRLRFGKPDASLCANGWLSGLVASTAGAGLLSPVEAVFTGMVAGIATPLLVELLELVLSLDDSTGAIPVHGLGGLWGLLAVGIFHPQPGQMMAQLMCIATLVGLVLPLLYLLLMGLNRLLPFRVDADGERLGMDLHELGGGAYPEFVLHRDDSYR